MDKQEDTKMNKPTTSYVPKEPSAYTPSWMSPKDRLKLKARIMEIRKKEWGLKKEEEVLIQRSPSRESQGNQRVRSARDLMKKKDSTTSEDDAPLGHHTSAVSNEPSLTAHSTLKKDRLKKLPKPRKGSKDGASKKKSKDELTMAKKSKAKQPFVQHANPSGNIVVDEQPWIPHPRDTIEAHLWATDYRHFDPQLYAFKTPEKLSTKKPVVAECPPFWVLNDHTIAVAWKLFCKNADRSDLGIVALQWSREFVSAMKDERGEYPGAIKHLLDAIEDGLIFRYSRAAEDSVKAHQKDDISYASSDSVFKQPTEVSHTLKDILSRNFPGRKFCDDFETPSNQNVEKTLTVVNKTALPYSVLSDGEAMKQRDIVALLKQCKIEQEARVKHEINASREIEKLLKQAQDGKLPVQRERRDHVGFEVPGSEPILASTRPKRLVRDPGLKQTKSNSSNKSTKSDGSAMSEKSTASGKLKQSPESSESALSKRSAVSSPSLDSSASTNAKGMQKKRSKEKVDSTSFQEKSKGNINKKQSTDSVSSRTSRGSTSSKKKRNEGSRKNKGRADSRTSNGSQNLS